MLRQLPSKVKETLDPAAGLRLKSNDVLAAILDEDGEIEPQQHTTIEDFLMQCGGADGVGDICRSLAKRKRTGPFVGLLHEHGAALYQFPRPSDDDKLPAILTADLIARAICSGIRRGEVFEVALCDDRRLTVMGRRCVAQFFQRWRCCFVGSQNPRADRIYLAVVHSGGAYLVEI